jgi:hypothetical protein
MKLQVHADNEFDVTFKLLILYEKSQYAHIIFNNSLFHFSFVSIICNCRGATSSWCAKVHHESYHYWERKGYWI